MRSGPAESALTDVDGAAVAVVVETWRMRFCLMAEWLRRERRRGGGRCTNSIGSVTK